MLLHTMLHRQVVLLESRQPYKRTLFTTSVKRWRVRRVLQTNPYKLYTNEVGSLMLS